MRDSFPNADNNNTDSLSMYDQLERIIEQQSETFVQEIKAENDAYQAKCSNLLVELNKTLFSSDKTEQSTAQFILDFYEINHQENEIEIYRKHENYQSEQIQRIYILSSKIQEEIASLENRTNTYDSEDAQTSDIIQDIRSIIRHKQNTLEHLINLRNKTIDSKEDMKKHQATSFEKMSSHKKHAEDSKETILSDIAMKYAYIKGEIAHLYTLIPDTVTKNIDQLNRNRLEIGQVISLRNDDLKEVDYFCVKINQLLMRFQVPSFIDSKAIEETELKEITTRLNEIDRGIKSDYTPPLSPQNQIKLNHIQEQLVYNQQELENIEKAIQNNISSEGQKKTELERIVKDDKRSLFRRILFTNKDISRLKNELSILQINKKGLLEKKQLTQRKINELIDQQSQIKHIDTSEITGLPMEKEILLLRKKIIETKSPLK